MKHMEHGLQKVWIEVTAFLPATMQNGLWSDQQYGPHKLRTVYKYLFFLTCLLQQQPAIEPRAMIPAVA